MNFVRQNSILWQELDFVKQNWHRIDLCDQTELKFLKQNWTLLNRSEFCHTILNLLNRIEFRDTDLISLRRNCSLTKLNVVSKQTWVLCYRIDFWGKKCFFSDKFEFCQTNWMFVTKRQYVPIGDNQIT